MNANEFILRQLGIGSADTILDEIQDNFDIEITSEDVSLAIELDKENVQNNLIGILYSKIISRANKEQKLKREWFNYNINGQDSHLYYDDTKLRSLSDIKDLGGNEDE